MENRSVLGLSLIRYARAVSKDVMPRTFGDRVVRKRTGK